MLDKDYMIPIPLNLSLFIYLSTYLLIHLSIYLLIRPSIPPSMESISNLGPIKLLRHQRHQVVSLFEFPSFQVPKNQLHLELI